MRFDELTKEHKKLIFKVLDSFNISPSNKESVEFTRIGMKRGYNSAIHRVSFEDGRTFAIKITDPNEDPVLNMLHNRELFFSSTHGWMKFYTWLDEVISEGSSDPDDFSYLLNFYGGTRCDIDPGILIFNDLSNRVGIQPNYTIGYEPYVIFQLVKQIVAYQSIYLCTEKDVSIGKQLIKYDSTPKQSIPKLDGVVWMSEKEKRCFREWTHPENLFALHTQIPEGVEGISPVLIHTDLWNGNIIFQNEKDRSHLLAILDWATFKIGNPLIDIATIIGENMNTEDRRSFTP